MTHEQLTQFDIYRRACFGSQAMCFCLVNHIEQRYRLTPAASATGYLQWQPNFALIQTLGIRTVNLTINLSGQESHYRSLGVDDLFRSPWKGLTRLRFTDAGRIVDLVTAAERAYAIKTRT
jgi:hypothetical protein